MTLWRFTESSPNALRIWCYLFAAMLVAYILLSFIE